MATEIIISVDEQGEAEVITTTGAPEVVVDVKVAPQLAVSGPGFVENSDQTYQETVPSEQTVAIPDINITQADDTVVQYPAVKDLDVDDFQGNPVTPRAYTYGGVTKATVSYYTGDAKDIEDTILSPARTAQVGNKPNFLTDIRTLAEDNAFGNKNRFTDSEGLQNYGGAPMSGQSSNEPSGYDVVKFKWSWRNISSSYMRLNTDCVLKGGRTEPEFRIDSNSSARDRYFSSNFHKVDTATQYRIRLSIYLESDANGADGFTIGSNYFGTNSRNYADYRSTSGTPLTLDAWNDIDITVTTAGTVVYFVFTKGASEDYLNNTSLQYGGCSEITIEKTTPVNPVTAEWGYVVDNLTGLGWFYPQFNSETVQPAYTDQFTANIDRVSKQVDNGHSDWFAPSANQLESLVFSDNSTKPFGYDYPTDFPVLHYQQDIMTSCKAGYNNTSNYLVYDTGENGITTQPTSSRYFSVLCRKHF